ncbi:short-chain dehydrogenase/reductase SDR [Pirellula staleyi DSM 6068]|uniref:Short-chain dehydrogenase/reductase SDR n=1 Tax=Pirellula staleyi (strain ATCC 27377 / DSM 6068 / ICPB 4128) TaxID=530564 RepID=D2QZ43_PIRSD|nr:glucose 1-dehydrogenase [Pirellula staleyi]ADB18235.1 short-chain dehydrogenase/reductase SDR [Pirellula staleyi DSM 6068]
MTDVNLKGRVAVVTGASLGIGRAAALELARCGASVVVNYRSHLHQAEEVIAEVEKLGSRGIVFQADVADQGAVEAMVQAAVDNFGRLDIAVSNAAYSDRERFFEADMAGFHRTVNVTMWGAFYLMRAATQQMIRQGEGGAICLVSSPHAFIPAPKAMAYNMSKAAIEHAARTAAIEVAEYKIRINLIQPGWTDTPGERKFASEETLQSAGAKIPLGRLGNPEEMGRAIAFLCDPRNDYLTGAALLVDGGISLPWWANRGSAAPA